MAHAPFPGWNSPVDSLPFKQWLIKLEHRVHTLEDDLGVGSDVQAWDTNLDQIAALTPTDSNIIVGDGAAWVAESGATARTSLGVGTGDSPQVTAVNIGHASDTTLSRKSAGIVAVEGIHLTRAFTSMTDNVLVRAHTTGTDSLIQDGVGITNNDDGSVTNASQPCFLAYNSTIDTNQTGNGAVPTIDFDTEVFDQGGDFATDTFTAPVTGKYLLSCAVELVGITAAADSAYLWIRTSNRDYRRAWVKTNDIPTELTLNLSAVADMDANDTVYILVQVNGEASDVVDIQGGAGGQTYFSGALLC